MINLAVINLRKIIKGIAKIIIVTLVVAMIFKFMSIMKNIDIKTILKNRVEQTEKNIIQTSSIFLNKQDWKKEDIILDSELSSLGNIIAQNSFEEKTNKLYESLEINKLNETIKINKVVNIEKANNVNLKTMVIEENNKSEIYNTVYETVKIKNESIYDLTEDILKPDIEFTNKKDIIIFHTHTCESYIPTEKNKYEETGNFRTTDLNFSVARVGKELSDCLITKGYNVIHDTTYHDYPAYNGSYNRSMKTVKSILEKTNSSPQLVIDLHRDALGSNSSYGPTVMIGEEQVSQLMFVIGTNGGGLKHDNWIKNFKLAVLIQSKANEMYPRII